MFSLVDTYKKLFEWRTITLETVRVFKNVYELFCGRGNVSAALETPYTGMYLLQTAEIWTGTFSCTFKIVTPKLPVDGAFQDTWKTTDQYRSSEKKRTYERKYICFVKSLQYVDFQHIYLQLAF